MLTALFESLEYWDRIPGWQREFAKSDYSSIFHFRQAIPHERSENRLTRVENPIIRIDSKALSTSQKYSSSMSATASRERTGAAPGGHGPPLCCFQSTNPAAKGTKTAVSTVQPPPVLRPARSGAVLPLRAFPKNEPDTLKMSLPAASHGE